MKEPVDIWNCFYFQAGDKKNNLFLTALYTTDNDDLNNYINKNHLIQLPMMVSFGLIFQLCTEYSKLKYLIITDRSLVSISIFL